MSVRSDGLRKIALQAGRVFMISRFKCNELDACNSNVDSKTTTESTNNGVSKITTNIKNVSPKHDDFKRDIVAQQSKAQKGHNNKIEKEQIKITEELIELKETVAGEFQKIYSELKSYHDNKGEYMKQELRNLHTQTEHLNKENIDLKCKAKITVTRIYIKKPVEH